MNDVDLDLCLEVV